MVLVLILFLDNNALSKPKHTTNAVFQNHIDIWKIAQEVLSIMRITIYEWDKKTKNRSLY